MALTCAGPALLDAPFARAQQVAAPFADVPRGGETAVSLAEISVSASRVVPAGTRAVNVL